MKTKLLLAATILAFYFLTSFSFAQITSGIGMHVIAGGQSSTQKCGNSINSCGKWPNCQSLANLTYCVNGKIYESYCLSTNLIRNRSTYATCTEFTLNLTDDDENENSADFYMYSVGTSNVLGSGTISGPDRIIFTPAISKTDFELRHDDSRMIFIMKNLDVTKLSGSIKVIIDKKDIDPDINGVNPLRSYHVELPSQFSYSSIILKLKYDSDEVDDENKLVVYRCGSFNPQTNLCNVNWTRMSNVTIDKTNNIVSLTLSSFSVYMLGEQGQNTTTTTTTTVQSNTTTTTSTTSTTTIPIIYSGGGGSGSDGSDVATTSTNEETTIPSITEELSEQSDDAVNTTSENITQTQGTNPATSFASMIEQNKLLIASPFIALAAGYALYYSFQKSGQPFSKHSGRSKVYKKLAKPLKAKGMKKSNKEYSGTVLKL